jgi:hypothetical protein
MNRFASGPWKIKVQAFALSDVFDSAPQSFVTVRPIFSDGPEPATQAPARFFGDLPFSPRRLPALAAGY